MRCAVDVAVSRGAGDRVVDYYRHGEVVDRCFMLYRFLVGYVPWMFSVFSSLCVRDGIPPPVYTVP